MALSLLLGASVCITCKCWLWADLWIEFLLNLGGVLLWLAAASGVAYYVNVSAVL
jgi:hypothetical protein